MFLRQLVSVHQQVIGCAEYAVDDFLVACTFRRGGEPGQISEKHMKEQLLVVAQVFLVARAELRNSCEKLGSNRVTEWDGHTLSLTRLAEKAL
jgi:hypothetical protein